MKTLLFAGIGVFLSHTSFNQTSLTGAWSHANGSTEMLYVVVDDYLTFSSYDKLSKTFNHTWGGPIKVDKDKFSVAIEYNSANADEVGRTAEYSFTNEGNKLILTRSGEKSSLTRIDDGKGELAGNWRISGRMQGDKMNTINPGPRKTLKILSGSRFQWIAINTETKEFFGTGGGTYTFKDGKYTESIEFFSRDKSRVGATLVFDGRLVNGVWVHSGLNSKGEPLHEEWSRNKF